MNVWIIEFLSADTVFWVPVSKAYLQLDFDSGSAERALRKMQKAHPHSQYRLAGYKRTSELPWRL